MATVSPPEALPRARGNQYWAISTGQSVLDDSASRSSASSAMRERPTAQRETPAHFGRVRLVAMAVDTAHQIRVVVLPKSAQNNSEINKIAQRTLGIGWRVQRLTRGSRLVLLTGKSEHTVGTPEHARESHEAALALYRSKQFSRVEADVPVPVDVEPGVDATGAFGDDPCVNNPPPLDWVHQILRWPEAMAAMSNATRGGIGISLGQPDSGYTLHPNLGTAGLDLTRDRDVIDGDDDALDDLIPNPAWPLPNPGHGTRTASVIVGQGTPTEGIVGLAGRSLLVPIRATESVVQLFDSDVAKAVAHARQVGCHVVTMSLGGKGFFGLKGEIQRAVDAGMIVMAAAGNYVRIVTAPASYDNCLAVAATGPGDIALGRLLPRDGGRRQHARFMRVCRGVQRPDPDRADGRWHLLCRRTSGGGGRAVAGTSRPPVTDQQVRGEAHPGRFPRNAALAGRLRRAARVGSRLRCRSR